MHPNTETVCVDITNATPEQMQEIGEMFAQSANSEIESIAKLLDVSDSCAMDVWYLRGRSRWTEALEAELIRLYQVGTPPNIMEFGH